MFQITTTVGPQSSVSGSSNYSGDVLSVLRKATNENRRSQENREDQCLVFHATYAKVKKETLDGK